MCRGHRDSDLVEGALAPRLQVRHPLGLGRLTPRRTITGLPPLPGAPACGGSFKVSSSGEFGLPAPDVGGSWALPICLGCVLHDTSRSVAMTLRVIGGIDGSALVVQGSEQHSSTAVQRYAGLRAGR